MSEFGSEAEAVHRLRDRDIAGLETLLRLHQTRALRVAYGIIGSREGAEDVVMDVFIGVAQIDQLDIARPFVPWFDTG